jgi:hypothetical protein
LVWLGGQGFPGRWFCGLPQALRLFTMAHTPVVLEQPSTQGDSG